MRDSARRAVATITISPHDQGQAVQLLGIDPETVYSIPNRVDIDHFIPYRPSPEERGSHWPRWLAGEPQGWDKATSTPGTAQLIRNGDARPSFAMGTGWAEHASASALGVGVFVPIAAPTPKRASAS
jgi:hypothetical protein